MEQYVRPAIAPQEFRDADGRVIPYGERWGMGSPPDDTYSVLSHPERFQPLHDVARALIAYLERNYNVGVSENPGHLAALPEDYVTGTTAVRLTPTNSDATPITIAFTSHPGIVVVSGVVRVEPFPVCGCDACDATWESESDRLESEVFAIVAGGLAEHPPTMRHRSFRQTLTRADGWSSGEVNTNGFSRERQVAARERLKELGGAWAAWSPREA
ncbi:DUF6226 family protein [Demequina sp. TTPB684]|uniref:DUF6226 family protein n=1 Tax=unclassified Demequina TaxID=2620311 RepID=UPI001CF5182C|nr:MULTISPECIES: DUF6226 family protein [unclassified Demequina]MCB2412756.1 DUF6226 family protein [Demequina sp. TTPB684]UPU88867.1 DUF6226 family protein [Demequina sp. TMPB413]